MCPLYYRFDVKYGDRSGSWFIAASDGNPAGLWVWRDAQNRSDLPLVRHDQSRVDNSVLALGYFAGNLIGVGFLLGFIGLLVYFFLLKT